MSSVRRLERLYIPAEQLRDARPDSITSLGQLTAGQVVIGFRTYTDHRGLVNQHLSGLAVVEGPALRVVSGEISDRVGLGRHVRVEPLPSYSLDRATYADPSWLCLENQGVEDCNKAPVMGTGLLAVRQEPSQVESDLEVGPGLYVNGANDFDTLFKGRFMAVALDSNPLLLDQLR